jgi:hypothetical protein
VTGDADGPADQEKGWERLRTRMDVDVPELQRNLAAKNWDVETRPDNYVFMENASREIQFFLGLTHDEIAAKLLQRHRG